MIGGGGVQSLSHVQLFCDPMHYSLPSFSVHGISQATILEWVAISFSRGIFLTQRLTLCLLHCRQILYQLSHKGSPSGKEPASQCRRCTSVNQADSWPAELQGKPKRIKR